MFLFCLSALNYINVSSIVAFFMLLRPGETRKTSSKKKLEDPSGSKDSSAAGSKDADSDAVVSASKTGAGASAAIAKAFSAAKMNSSELVGSIMLRTPKDSRHLVK